MATEALSTIKGVSGIEIPVYDVNYDNSQMDQEGFLKVLLTSFAYQDPFETQDISKFIDNTVKLRELEIMKNFEDSVQSLSGNDALLLNATNLIGKKVMYEGDKVYVENGRGYAEFRPAETADSATAYLYDASGNVVAQKSFTNLQPNATYSFEIEDTGIQDGYYSVSVVAKRGEEPVKVTVYSEAKVDGVEKRQEGIMALVDGEKVSLADIVKIGG